jgi:hypothetical protein
MLGAREAADCALQNTAPVPAVSQTGVELPDRSDPLARGRLARNLDPVLAGEFADDAAACP